ncbi:MAG TPA: M20/M25/M40 family metallo-hydrolase, partial [Actinomycetota bacterium]|nr:M20/M25/M40 family metallo-hydrolase [Actinomycetota bacterium]
ACDDKGNFFPLLYVACELAEKDELPVNVRCLIEGEEEVAGTSAHDWLVADDRGADCAVVFDSDMMDADTPALTIAVRGIVAFSVEVRCAPRDLHSGLYGGAALNSVHVLHAMLDRVLPGPDGLLRDELRAGITPPTPEELDSWASFVSGDEVVSEVGGRPIDPSIATDYWRRNGADASLDVNGIEGGDAVQTRTIIPATARAKFTIRLAPGQSYKEIGAAAEALMREAIPPNADATIEWDGNDGALFDPTQPALALGIKAIEEASGMTVALQRSGGSIPVLKTFYDRGIPTILSGFALAADAIHGVDESYRLESIALGERSARRLYENLSHVKDGR